MKKHVVMLDSLVAASPNCWPVTLQDDDLETLRQATTFDGNAVEYSPRSAYRLTRLEGKSLCHALRPGEPCAGAIYERQ